MSMSFKVESYSARPARHAGTGAIELEVEYCDKDEILGQFSVSDILDLFSEADLLNGIGKEAAMGHFDLEAKP